ncbi:MAG: lysophospholipid acyltransferase family protein [Labilithrix sp.]
MDATAARARDVREGGRWSLAQRLKNDVLFALATIAIATASRVPRRVVRSAGRAVGALAWLVLPRLRRLAEENAAEALPGVEPRAFVRCVYRDLGARLGEVVSGLGRARAPLPFAPGSRDVLASAIAEGRGVVFASAHLGPWEHVAASLVAHGIPLTAVAREPYDPRFVALYARLRQGVRTVYRGADGAGVALVRVLRRGGVLGIPMDLASRVASVEVPFLGRPARTAVGPARLAIRTGAALVVGTATPEGALFFERIPPSDDEIELTARINVALGERIRAWPEAWLWMHDRWTTSRMLGP